MILNRPLSLNGKALTFGGLSIIAVCMILLINLLIAPFVIGLFENWSSRDLENRSKRVGSSVQANVESLIATAGSGDISQRLDEIAANQRVRAIALCDQNGIRFRSSKLPAGFRCGNARFESMPIYTVIYADEQPLFAATYPITNAALDGHLVVLQQPGFANAQTPRGRRSVAVLLSTFVLLGSAATIGAAILFVSLWRSRMRQTLVELRTGGPVHPETLRDAPLGPELYELIRDLDHRREVVDGDAVQWSAETLKAVISENLGNSQIITVSNREPYIHNLVDGRIELQQPASGLVSALEPVMRACGGTWIAHGSGSADDRTADAQGRIAVPPRKPEYTLRRIWISEEEQKGYYYGLANEGLWPLCHIAYVRPVFREDDWQQYKAINERFAAAIVEEAEQPDPIVLIQDYHFALLPGMVRTLLPQATIVTFWHIPWPNAETFGICPWKSEILRGLLGSTVLGFHTRFHCNNFIDTVDRYAESRIDREVASITLADHETFIRPYPISIEWPPAAMDGQSPIEQARADVRARYGLGADTRIAVGVERFDYTKGILDRMHAVDALLGNFPEWRERFVLLQIAAPSRSELDAYRSLQIETIELAEKINARHGTEDWEPIKLVAEHRNPHEVFELFRAADVCIVSSLHDGMNLVAKEFVASRDDEQGVLILSNFAGASRELAEALIVNPFDAHSVGEQLNRALTMPVVEQSQRMRLMRDHIRSRNVYRWAGKMLLDAELIRKKRTIAQIELEYEGRR